MVTIYKVQYQNLNFELLSLVFSLLLLFSNEQKYWAELVMGIQYGFSAFGIFHYILHCR